MTLASSIGVGQGVCVESLPEKGPISSGTHLTFVKCWYDPQEAAGVDDNKDTRSVAACCVIFTFSPRFPFRVVYMKSSQPSGSYIIPTKNVSGRRGVDPPSASDVCEPRYWSCEASLHASNEDFAEGIRR